MPPQRAGTPVPLLEVIMLPDRLIDIPHAGKPLGQGDEVTRAEFDPAAVLGLDNHPAFNDVALLGSSFRYMKNYKMCLIFFLLCVTIKVA